MLRWPVVGAQLMRIGLAWVLPSSGFFFLSSSSISLSDRDRHAIHSTPLLAPLQALSAHSHTCNYDNLLKYKLSPPSTYSTPPTSPLAPLPSSTTLTLLSIPPSLARSGCSQALVLLNWNTIHPTGYLLPSAPYHQSPASRSRETKSSSGSHKHSIHRILTHLAHSLISLSGGYRDAHRSLTNPIPNPNRD